MKKFINKKLMTAIVGFILLGIASTVLAASTPVPPNGTRLESTFRVGNVTSNANYAPSVGAQIDDVVRYEIWYHNTEVETSGKNANNVNIKVTLPTSTSRNHTATAVVGGSNTNVITNTALVTTSVDTYLEYIPGTAYRRHNTGTNANPIWVTERISDNVVSASGYTFSTMNPCWNFQETITVQARVRANALTINKQVKIEGGSTWLTSVDAQPGQTVAYLITFTNVGNTTLRDVLIRDNMPPRMEYIPGSARLFNTTHPNGVVISDLLIQGGVNVGDYSPGANAQVRFQARVPQAVDRCVNDYFFNNVGVVRPAGMGEFYNTARVVVDYPCSVTPPPTPPTPPTPTPITPTAITGKGSLPTSGPAEAVAGTLGTISLAGAAGYYRKAKLALKNSFKKF